MDNYKIYIGIDPGAKGYLAIYDGVAWAHCPLADTDQCITLLESAAQYKCVAVVEDVHAMPRQGVASTFNFGYNVGTVIGWLQALHIPYHQVTPRKWQGAMWERKDKVIVSGKADAKRTSLNCARRLLPDMDWRRTPKCKVADDNKIDATLLCMYAMQTYQII